RDRNVTGVQTCALPIWPRTTLSPGMVLRDGRPYLAFGSPGGDQQDQWVVPFLVNHLVHGMDLQAAIDAPTWHSTHWPSSFAPRVAEPAGLHAEDRPGRSEEHTSALQSRSELVCRLPLDQNK